MNDVPGHIDTININEHFAFIAGKLSLDTVPVPDHCLWFCNFSVDRGDT